MESELIDCVTWMERYRPKKISDIVCNEGAVRLISDWLKAFPYNKKKALTERNGAKKRKTKRGKKVNERERGNMVVTGDHGVGKTMMIDVILKEYNYEINRINFNDIKNKRKVEDVMNRVMKTSNILSLMNDTEKKKIAIVVDEIESITSTTEKNYIFALQKSNGVNWYCPMIFISNNKHTPILSKTRREAYEVKVETPRPMDLKKIIKQVEEGERIKIKKGESEKVEYLILEHSQLDVRKLLYTMQDIKNMYNKKIITIKILEEYRTISKKKDADIHLFRAAGELLQNYNGINNSLRLYETDKVLLPLMVHQNYINNMMASKCTMRKKFELLNKMAKALSYGDVVENYIYGDQNWDMQKMHGIHTCVVTSYYLETELERTEEEKRRRRVQDVKFTTDLNKTSIKKINRKNINNTNKCFKNMSIMDYIYINKIVWSLINEGEIEECVNLMRGYNIKLEHIESLLKIDKIENAKRTLTSKQRKEFEKYLSL